MPVPSAFDYAVLRVVPRVEREEFINAGVILFCRSRRFLDARIALDPTRLLALDPQADIAEVERHLALIPRLCQGGRDAGPIGQLSQAERWHWLVAPRSTVIQTGPAHCGLCDDLAATLDHLVAAMVH